ncbi:MAG: hypothetical protein ACJAZO_003182 [Myxococcota bacterium]|jgi:hypothetical protein
MSILAPFAHDGRGRVYVTADGPEVYAYSGVDDSPLWKDFADGIIVGLAISGDHVVGVDSDGVLIRWRIFDGQRVDVTSTDVACLGIAADPYGGVALLTDFGVRVYGSGGHVVDAAVPRANSVAKDTSGSRIVVTTEDGRLVWIDGTTGSVVGEVVVPAPAHMAAWSSQGSWVVGAADKLLVITADPSESPVVSMFAPGGPVEAVAVSADGWLLAARVGATDVSLLTSSTGETLATVGYNRPVGGVFFGSDTWLAIALEYADVNRIELGAGRLTRNGPGLGRSSDPWATNLKLDAGRVRGALARSRAGGAPVAMRVERQSPGTYESEVPGRPKWVLPAVIAVAVLMMCSCSSCCGIFAYLR